METRTAPSRKWLLSQRKVIEVDGIRPGAAMASCGCDLVVAEMTAREMDVRVWVFGHIHRPLNREGSGVCSSVQAAQRFPACGAISFLWAALLAIISSSLGNWHEGDSTRTKDQRREK